MNRSDVWRRYHGDVRNKQKEKRLGKKFRFPLELNEKTNEGGRVATDFVRLFNFLYAKKLSFEKEGHCSTNAGKNSVKFTDKVPFLTDLSVSKTHFTDKRLFLPILSVIAFFRASQLRTKAPFSSMCP